MNRNPSSLRLFFGALLVFSIGALVAWAAKPTAKTMTERGFAIHTVESAPEASAKSLAWYQENFGMVPNVVAIMAESPALLNSYWQLQQNLKHQGTLTPPEDNIVQMAIAYENKCQYCVAGHTFAGKVFFKSPAEQLDALRSNKALSTAKEDALRVFALAVYEKQGRVSEEEVKTFLEAGYTRAQALDVVGGIAAKVMTNFTNQLALTPTDEAFKELQEGLPFAEDRKAVLVPAGAEAGAGASE